MNDIIEHCAEILQRGGLLLYPTDTIWGLGCDARLGHAVEKIYALKRRDPSKSMLVLCADTGMVERHIGPVSDEVSHLLTASERPTTVIMPVRLAATGQDEGCDEGLSQAAISGPGMLAHNLIAADGTIGVRIPKMEFCQRLLRALDAPIVSTSANISGRPSPTCFADIDKELKATVDYVVPQTMEGNHATAASRIVKIATDGSVITIRE